jgi:hypothetical protein
VASDGDTILVSAGTYYENINFNGKNIALIGEDRETTIIDGGHNGSVVIFDSGEDSTTYLNKFTIQNGYADGPNGYDMGGGILVMDSSPILDDLIVEKNEASWGGGGINFDNSDRGVLKNSIVRENIGASQGGGIYIVGNSNEVFIEKVLLYNNIANANDNNDICCGSGAAVHIHYNSTAYLDKVTIVGNNSEETTNVLRSLILIERSSELHITNSIIWDNNIENIIIKEINSYPSILNISYTSIQGGESVIEGNWEGEGNIDLDPQFTDPENGDFTIQPSSPCIDAGDPNSPLDPDGTITDMGAYYYHQDPVYGCTDEGACNYNSEATDDDASCTYAEENFDCDGNCIADIDCNGDCAGTAVLDNCNICDSGNTNDCVQDCNGTWGGTAVLDECGTCDSDPSNDCFDTNMELHSGANLKSFYALPSDKSVSNVFETLGDNLTGVITEGGAASQIAPGVWVGSLSEINYKKGYWLILTGDAYLLQFDVISTNTDILYDLRSGANLISYPSSGSGEVSASLPDDIEPYISGIITEGGAASQIAPGVWAGSLGEFQGGKGYWVISSTNISFSFIID